jgi:two-component system sensor histidine kinase BaeS
LSAPRRGGRLNSLRVRLLLPIGLIVLVSVAGTLLLAAYLTRQAATSAARHNLARQADVLAAQERTRPCPTCSAELGPLNASVLPLHERIVFVPLHQASPYISAAERAKLKRKEPIQFRRDIDGEDSLVAARQVTSQGRDYGFLLIRSAKLEGSDTGPFVESLLLAATVGSVLAILAALVLTRLIAGRVEHVSDAIRRFSDEESPSHLAVEGPNELASLAASFNHMADELARAREAERAFLLSVSHELKTPLTSIRGYAEALAEDAVDPSVAAETLRAEAGRLERLVHDLLDLARMNRSTFDVRREPLELGDAALEAVRRYEPLAQTLGVTLEARLDAPMQVLGDEDRVQQVIGNLVENALRVTPVGGGVRVCVERAAVRVEDDGPGLEPEELARAFERFYLHSRYGKDRKVGTGLGLAIVKQLTEAMGGSVDVASEPGEGAAFTVRLTPTDAASAVLRPAYERRTPG